MRHRASCRQAEASSSRIRSCPSARVESTCSSSGRLSRMFRRRIAPFPGISSFSRRKSTIWPVKFTQRMDQGCSALAPYTWVLPGRSRTASPLPTSVTLPSISANPCPSVQNSSRQLSLSGCSMYCPSALSKYPASRTSTFCKKGTSPSDAGVTSTRVFFSNRYTPQNCFSFHDTTTGAFGQGL